MINKIQPVIIFVLFGLKNDMYFRILPVLKAANFVDLRDSQPSASKLMRYQTFPGLGIRSLEFWAIHSFAHLKKLIAFLLFPKSKSLSLLF